MTKLETGVFVTNEQLAELILKKYNDLNGTEVVESVVNRDDDFEVTIKKNDTTKEGVILKTHILVDRKNFAKVLLENKLDLNGEEEVEEIEEVEDGFNIKITK